MKKYMILYISSAKPGDTMKNMSPDDMKKMMEPWNTWFQKAGSAVVDQGTPLIHGTLMSKDGNSMSTAPITGYTILQAEDLQTIEALVMDHPYKMMPDARLEVWEMMPVAM